MDDHLYRDIILEHWKNPHHYGVLRNPTISVKKNNPLCGDSIHLTVKLIDRTIGRIGFISEGCAISKASASLLSDVVEKMLIEEVKNISSEDFLKELGITLTPSREKCALLGYTALQNGLMEHVY